jgi:hypothetical protein
MEQVWNNIKVMNGLPSDELMETMNYWRVSLGVNCDHCHVHSETGGLSPELDTKPQKQKAREMVAMVRAINQQYFDGQQRVTCGSCHQGHTRPIAAPQVIEAETARQRREDEVERLDVESGRKPAQPLPTADALFQKHAQAIGGDQAIAAITSKYIKSTVTPAIGSAVTVEQYQKAPNRVLSIATPPQGLPSWVGYDGTRVWQQNGQTAAFELTGPEVQPLHVNAELLRDLRFRGRYANAYTQRKDRINGHDVYVVRGELPNEKFAEQVFFDQQSGMLLRRVTFTRTRFGPMVEQQDFEDYREVSGVKFPFTVRTARQDSVTVRKATEILLNVPIDDSAFAMPKQ